MIHRLGTLRAIRYGALLLCVVIALTAFVRLRAARQAPLPVYWSLPTYSLQNQQGGTVTSGDLTGKVVVANLIYTRCPDVCPAVLEPNMGRLQASARSAGLLGTHLMLLSLTADPAYDTPPVLAEFAGHFNADPSAWLFLTGNPDTVKGLIFSGFKLDVEPSTSTDRVIHDSHVLLIDQRQRVRGIYDGLDVQPSAILDDAKRLIEDQGT